MYDKQLVNSAMIVVLALLFSYGAGYVHCATVPENSTDMLSLLNFRRASTRDPSGLLSSWNSSVDYCKWNGVTCSRTHPGRVRELNLTGQSLQGQISPSIGNLTLLKILDLSSNNLFGQIPTLNRLRKLQHLFLMNNQLQEFAPDALTNCSNLVKLDLSSNMLAGSIPPQIGFLSNVQFLNLQTNNFTVVIPPSLHNITQLVTLLLSDNKLEGSIPDELGQLSKMQLLAIGENMLSGSIPTTILNHSSLAILDVNSNFLRMELPSTIGNTLPRIVALGMQNNMFQGQIPASLGNASFLSVIYFFSNNFTGQIPSSLGKLSNLQSLILDQNKLEANDSKSWEFLDALANCKILQVLSFYGNQLQGAIPNSIGKLSPGLQTLGLDGNNLSGTVPESIGNLNGLTLLLLGQNNLGGPIGTWIGSLKNLQGLSLSGNNFSGPIPSSIGSFSQLTKLYLQSNSFEGPIPPSFGNLQQLSVLNLSCNNLHGQIPTEFFSPGSTMTTCLLSYNNLEGSIPPEVRNLQQLNVLRLSSNKLAGEIPSTLGECHQLQILQIDDNFLSGTISKSLGSLKSLSMLNLSHNNLSGVIPVELGNLSILSQVDLSYNDLQDQIPRDGAFRNATAVSLVGNRGLCGGVLELDMPSCPPASRRKVAQYYLIRVLIPIFVFLSLLLLIYFVLTERTIVRAPSWSPLGDQFPIVSSNDLAQATQNFSESNLIGRGSCGSVYRGRLMKSKQEVAVKVLDLDMRGAEKSFLSECEALRSIRHRNLAPIITACSTEDINGNVFKALIYEFMPNGNLDSWLHQKGEGKARKPLDLHQRTCIAVNIADILDYLHHESGKTIIHCDVKPSNILLDDDMNARLGDFGIAKFFLDSRSTATGDSNINSSIGVKGTIGYIAPEYARGGHPSTHGDVYSFGIVILEMLTGKRPTDHLFENEQNIVNFVERNFPDQLLNVIDTPLQEECRTTQLNMITENEAYQCLFSLLQVALSCTRQFPGERTTMREAASRMRAIKTSYAAGGRRAFVPVPGGHRRCVPVLGPLPLPALPR